MGVVVEHQHAARGADGGDEGRVRIGLEPAVRIVVGRAVRRGGAVPLGLRPPRQQTSPGTSVLASNRHNENSSHLQKAYDAMRVPYHQIGTGIHKWTRRLSL